MKTMFFKKGSLGFLSPFAYPTARAPDSGFPSPPLRCQGCGGAFLNYPKNLIK